MSNALIYTIIGGIIFIIISISIVINRRKLEKEEKDLLKSFDEKVNDLSNNNNEDFTDGHLYK